MSLSQVGERLSPQETNQQRIERHHYRYRWADKFIVPEMSVLDAACGTGYGKSLLKSRGWIGVDRYDAGLVEPLVVADLHSWRGWRYLNYDVFVGLETIEHLDPANNYVAMAKAAWQGIVISTPVIPTCHFNPYHVRDWTPGEISDIFQDEHWSLVSYEVQEDTYGLWYFARI